METPGARYPGIKRPDTECSEASSTTSSDSTGSESSGSCKWRDDGAMGDLTPNLGLDTPEGVENRSLDSPASENGINHKRSPSRKPPARPYSSEQASTHAAAQQSPRGETSGQDFDGQAKEKAIELINEDVEQSVFDDYWEDFEREQEEEEKERLLAHAKSQKRPDEDSEDSPKDHVKAGSHEDSRNVLLRPTGEELGPDDPDDSDDPDSWSWGSQQNNTTMEDDQRFSPPSVKSWSPPSSKGAGNHSTDDLPWSGHLRSLAPICRTSSEDSVPEQIETGLGDVYEGVGGADPFLSCRVPSSSTESMSAVDRDDATPTAPESKSRLAFASQTESPAPAALMRDVGVNAIDIDKSRIETRKSVSEAESTTTQEQQVPGEQLMLTPRDAKSKQWPTPPQIPKIEATKDPDLPPSNQLQTAAEEEMFTLGIPTLRDGSSSPKEPPKNLPQKESQVIEVQHPKNQPQEEPPAVEKPLPEHEAPEEPSVAEKQPSENGPEEEPAVVEVLPFKEQPEPEASTFMPLIPMLILQFLSLVSPPEWSAPARELFEEKFLGISDDSLRPKSRRHDSKRRPRGQEVSETEDIVEPMPDQEAPKELLSEAKANIAKETSGGESSRGGPSAEQQSGGSQPESEQLPATVQALSIPNKLAPKQPIEEAPANDPESLARAIVMDQFNAWLDLLTLFHCLSERAYVGSIATYQWLRHGGDTENIPETAPVLPIVFNSRASGYILLMHFMALIHFYVLTGLQRERLIWMLANRQTRNYLLERVARYGSGGQPLWADWDLVWKLEELFEMGTGTVGMLWGGTNWLIAAGAGLVVG